MNDALISPRCLIIDHRNAFEFANAVTGSVTIEQFGSGTAMASDLAGFDGTLDVVAGELSVNDTASHAALDLEGGTFLASTNLRLSSGLTFANATDKFANGVLGVSDGKHSEQVMLNGTFSDASFALSRDHHGGVDVNYTGVS